VFPIFISYENFNVVNALMVVRAVSAEAPKREEIEELLKTDLWE
jgi:hypothetical protein